jgi:hypothetical protein
MIKEDRSDNRLADRKMKNDIIYRVKYFLRRDFFDAMSATDTEPSIYRYRKLRLDVKSVVRRKNEKCSVARSNVSHRTCATVQKNNENVTLSTFHSVISTLTVIPH